MSGIIVRLFFNTETWSQKMSVLSFLFFGILSENGHFLGPFSVLKDESYRRDQTPSLSKAAAGGNFLEVYTLFEGQTYHFGSLNRSKNEGKQRERVTKGANIFRGA